MVPDAATVVDALQAVNAATNNYHRAARALRNRIVVMAFVALASATLVVIAQWRNDSVQFIPMPDGTKLQSWQLILLVMLFGVVGALLTTIRPITQLPSANTPFNFPLYQALLKLIVGTLTSVVGLVLVSGITSDKGLSSLPAVLGAAAAFGATQQAVTRMLDDRAKALVGENPSTVA